MCVHGVHVCLCCVSEFMCVCECVCVCIVCVCVYCVCGVYVFMSVFVCLPVCVRGEWGISFSIASGRYGGGGSLWS